MNPRQEKGAAYHEAGHAVVAMELRIEWSRILLDTGATEDHFLKLFRETPIVSVSQDLPGLAHEYGMVVAAGGMSEKAFRGRCNGMEQDMEYVQEVADALAEVTGDEPQVHVDRILEDAQDLVTKMEPAVQKIALALILEREISYGRAVELIGRKRRRLKDCCRHAVEEELRVCHISCDRLEGRI